MTPKHIAECVSNMMPIECGIPDEAKIFSLLFEGYLPIVFVIAGGLCNGMSLVVLLDGPFLDLFNKLLVTLAICDSFFLAFGLPVNLQKAFTESNLQKQEKYALLLAIGKICTPLARISLNGSSYVTVSMAIERALGIGFPIASLNWPKRKLWMYLVPVAVLSVTVNIPEIYSAIAYFTGFPPFPMYDIWFFYSTTIVTTVIPWTFLLLTNIYICAVLQKRKSKTVNQQHHITATYSKGQNSVAFSSRSSQSRSARFDSKKSIASIRHSAVAKTTSTSVSLNGPPDGPPRIIRRKNNSTNVILLCIVLLFLVCHILRFFGLYYYDDLTEFADGCMQIYRNGTKECHETNGTSTNIYETPEVNYPKWLWSLNPVGSLLLLMNSSLNFVIYVLAGTRFRKTFLRKIKTLSSCLRRSAFTAETEIPINDSGLVTQGNLSQADYHRSSSIPSQRIDVVERNHPECGRLNNHIAQSTLCNGSFAKTSGPTAV